MRERSCPANEALLSRAAPNLTGEDTGRGSTRGTDPTPRSQGGWRLCLARPPKALLIQKGLLTADEIEHVVKVVDAAFAVEEALDPRFEALDRLRKWIEGQE